MSELGCQYIAAGLFEASPALPPTAQLAKLLESMDFDFDNYVDPRSAYYDDATGDMWVGIGAGETAENATWPTVTDENSLKLIRQECRLLATTNEFAINGHENRISYIVGTGHKYQAVAKKGVTVPDEHLASINRELEDFCKRNRWPARQQEIVRRFDRDGEVFLRFFERPADDVSAYSYTTADGKALSLDSATGRVLNVRFVEPGQILRPLDAASDPRATFGIVTDADDVETVEGYYVDGQLVDASDIQHRKANVDANVKRGMPLFFPVRKNLKRAEKLLGNVTKTASVQAAIGLIRKHRQASGTSVRTWLNAAADVTVTNRDAGTTSRHRNYPAGAIIDASADTEYDFPAASVNVERFVAGVQAELRAVAARLVMPEFMFTSDASNANYSSTLVSEGPADKMFQRSQSTQETYDLEIIDRVLDLGASQGRLPDNWRGLVKIEVHKPRVQVRDEKAEAEVNKIEKEAGALSLQTWSSRRGLDYEQEQDNIAEHRKAYGDNDLDPNAVMAATMKANQPTAKGDKGAAVKEALVSTLASCESPAEFLAALTEHCGANAPGGGGFQPGNTCANEDGDGQITKGGELEVKKLGYSVNPWRILLNGREISVNVNGISQSFSFRLKRDAVAVASRLKEIGDWSKADSFDNEQRSKIVAALMDPERSKEFANLAATLSSHMNPSKQSVQQKATSLPAGPIVPAVVHAFERARELNAERAEFLRVYGRDRGLPEFQSRPAAKERIALAGRIRTMRQKMQSMGIRPGEARRAVRSGVRSV